MEEYRGPSFPSAVRSFIRSYKSGPLQTTTGSLVLLAQVLDHIHTLPEDIVFLHIAASLFPVHLAFV